jgi:hypothetical protein
MHLGLLAFLTGDPGRAELGGAQMAGRERA